MGGHIAATDYHNRMCYNRSMTVERFRLMFDYELWANRRVLESLRRSSKRGEGVRLLAHILAAQDAWLTRLRGQDSSHVAIWPESGLEECEAALERLNKAIADHLAGLDEDGLAAEVVYRNQSGREFRSTPLDILTHLGLHSQHHRGQIALALRRLGEEPAVTDFIAFRREATGQA
jgi:uncharacterized damage-inducible protein DinB